MALPPRHSLDVTGLSREARKLGVGWCPAGVTGELNCLGEPDIQTRWQLDFSGEEIVYRELTAEAAQSLVADVRANATDVATFFGGIYDFVVGVYNGIYEVLSLIYEGGVATFNFIWDGVKHVFSVVVEFFEQAFGLVESIFAAIKVSFERLFEWLGFVFNWDDILRTRTALSYWVLEYLKFLEGAAGGMQKIFDDGIAGASREVDAAFKKLIDMVGAESPGGYVKGKEPHNPQMSSAAANNVVLNGLMGSGGASPAAIMAFEHKLGSVGDLDGFFAKLQELAQSVKDHPEFAAAMAYLNNLGGSPDEVFKQLLSGLLLVVQGVIKVALAGVQSIMHELLQMVASLMTGLRGILEYEWDHIPFVSDFYRWLTKTGTKPDGDPLTLLDLLALIIATPSTPLYKIWNSKDGKLGRAPFPDEASIAAFKATYTAEMLLGRAGFRPTSPDALMVSSEESNVFDAFSFIGTVAFGGVTVFLDCQTFTGMGKPNAFTQFFSKIALSAKIFAKACSFPLLIRPAGTACDNKASAAWVLYSLESIGLLMDTACVLRPKGTMPENDDTLIGPTATTIYGGIHALLVGNLWPHLSQLGQIAKVFILIPECTKWLRVVPPPVARVVVAVIDGVCISGSALAGALAGFTSQPGGADTEMPYPPGAVRLAY